MAHGRMMNMINKHKLKGAASQKLPRMTDEELASRPSMYTAEGKFLSPSERWEAQAGHSPLPWVLEALLGQLKRAKDSGADCIYLDALADHPAPDNGTLFSDLIGPAIASVNSYAKATEFKNNAGKLENCEALAKRLAEALREISEWALANYEPNIRKIAKQTLAAWEAGQ